MRFTASVATEPGERGQCTRMRFVAGPDSYSVWFQYPGEPGQHPIDAALMLALPGAMRMKLPLQLEGAVSRRLLDAVPTLQAIYHCWDPGLTPVPVEADARPDSAPRADPGLGAASLFTGGVDSFYTALKRQNEIATLVYVHGFDVDLQDTALRQQVSAALGDAAQRMGMRLIEVETDLRLSYSDRFLRWDVAYGSAMAALGMLLSSTLGKLYVPAGQSYHTLVPHGAHPLLTPLFSTEYLDFETDGCECSRIEKVAAIAQSDVAMDTLRVCWENRGGAYNCGECEKCLRTMASLEIANSLERCRTFKKPLDYRQLGRTQPMEVRLWSFNQEAVAAARRAGSDPRLIRALERSQKHSPLRKLRGRLVQPVRWIRRRFAGPG